MPTGESDPAQCHTLVDRALEENGRIDTLINNAGISMNASFEDLPDLRVLERVVQVNFWGSVCFTHFALPYLKATQGRIVVMISGGGKFPTIWAGG